MAEFSTPAFSNNYCWKQSCASQQNRYLYNSLVIPFVEDVFYIQKIVLNRISFTIKGTDRIHVYGILTYIWVIFMVNVGKYASPMDPIGSVAVYIYISDQIIAA